MQQNYLRNVKMVRKVGLWSLGFKVSLVPILLLLLMVDSSESGNSTEPTMTLQALYK